ncbi:MAG: HEAT repeat domain-containing protein [Elusimicrobiota bacterium]
MRKINSVFVLSLFILTIGCGGLAPVNTIQAAPNLTGVTQTLVDLLEKQDKTKISAEDYQSTSLAQIITFATPAGYRLKLRYLEFGVSLVEALKAARDPDLRKRLIEMVQWSRNPKVRAQAIITLASLGDPLHKKYFKEAVLDGKIGIRFAAVEALQTWGQAEAISLLQLAKDRDWSPLMQIVAAQALLSLGQESAVDALWKGLDHNSWVVRAMAARYLGDYGNPNDYPKIVSYLNRETRNDFVIAELSIAALKLISKKGEKSSYSPSQKAWRDNEEVAYTIGRDSAIELEPLVITPPRLKIPASLQIAAQINSGLLKLIRDRLGEPLDPIQQQDPILEELNSMVTPSGFALKTRYSELSYLLIEALGGTTDPLMRSELQRLAQNSTNPLVKASALIALSYSRDESDIYLVQDALADKNAIVRMGALEAVEVGRFKSAIPYVYNLAGNDASAAVQVYALQVLAKFGETSPRLSFLARLNDPDWPSRAMSYWYLSRYGTSDDYSQVLSRLGIEENPFVQAEIALATLRLAPVE